MSTQSIQFTDSNGNISLPESAESGSNANGSYTKFADGTLIQWGRFSITFNNSTLSESTDVPLPVSFIDTNYSCICSALGGNSTYIFSFIINPSNVIGFSIYAKNTTAITTTRTNQYIAIGRWK